MRNTLIALALTLAFGLGTTLPAHAHDAAKVKHKTVKAVVDENAQTGFGFSPTKLKIKVGTKVTWTNPSEAPHNVTATGKNWTVTKDLPIGAKVSYTFKKAGTYKYQCTFHPGMVGKVVVSK